MCMTQSRTICTFILDFGGIYNFPLVKDDFIRVKGAYILYTIGPLHGHPTYYNI